MALQKSLLQHLGKNYSAFVSAIEIVWKDKRTNLDDIILKVICHVEINKKNEENSADISNVKVLAANIYKAPKKTYTTKECMERGITTYYTDCT